MSTESEVTKLQEDLEIMQPLLAQAAKETEETMEKISVDTVVANETKEVVQKEEQEAGKKAEETQAIAGMLEFVYVLFWTNSLGTLKTWKETLSYLVKIYFDWLLAAFFSFPWFAVAILKVLKVSNEFNKNGNVFEQMRNSK